MSTTILFIFNYLLQLTIHSRNNNYKPEQPSLLVEKIIIYNEEGIEQ